MPPSDSEALFGRIIRAWVLPGRNERTQCSATQYCATRYGTPFETQPNATQPNATQSNARGTIDCATKPQSKGVGKAMANTTNQTRGRRSGSTLRSAAGGAAARLATVVAIGLPTPVRSVLPPALSAATSEPGNAFSRSLSTGDFGAVNELFENARILVPEEFEVSERVAFADLDLTIRNIECYDMSLGGIAVDHERTSDTSFLVTVGVSGLDVTCEMNYEYSYGILSGDGWLKIETENSQASSSVSFSGTDFDRARPPTGSAVQGCESDVGIREMDFEEDLASEVLEVFQGLVRNAAERAIGDVACEELSVAGTSVLGNLVGEAAGRLEPYLGHLGEAATDPLHLETGLVLPDDLEALDLQDTNGYVGRTVSEILGYLDAHLGASAPGSPGQDRQDLVVNSLLRSFVLEEDGSLPMDPASMPSLADQILFEGHDRLTEFSVTLNEIRLFGLDSITRLNSFRRIGKHTLQNELTWDSLSFEFDLTLDMKPSTLEDAILVDPTSPGIREDFTIGFALENIDVEVSLLLVLDGDAMGSMELGPLFHTENLLPCVLSVVHDARISGLDVDPAYVTDGPTLSGFVSSGLDRFVSDSIGAAFSVYEASLRTAVPNLFRTEVREGINAFLSSARASSGGVPGCPEAPSFDEGVLDFREFLDPESGGSYGDLVPAMKKMLDEELIATGDETGRPRINEALVAPFTGAQSGTRGTVVFPFDLFRFAAPNTVSQRFGMESLELRLFDPKIENIDTIQNPIRLFEPNATSGQILDNYATLGVPQRKLRIGVKGRIDAEGDPALATTNEIDLSVELSGAEAWVSLMARIDAGSLFRFPLRDVANPECWLNTLESPAAIGEGQSTGFALAGALLDTSAMGFNVSCASCTGAGPSVFPEMMGSLGAAGVSEVLGGRLVRLVLDLLRSDSTQAYINHRLMDAALRCPHSPEYVGPSASSRDDLEQEFPSLDHGSLETLVFAAAVAAEMATVVVARAHESYDLETSFPLSAQHDLGAKDDARLVDFTALEESVGEKASSGIAGFLAFLHRGADDPGGNGSLGVNSILRASLLDKNGEFSVSFEGPEATNDETGISLKELKIFGLDTISELKVFDAVGAQTLQNKIRWDEIRIQLVLSLGHKGDASAAKKSEITVSVGLSGVDLSLALFLEMDLDRLEALELWSIMETTKILPCLVSGAREARFTELELSIGSFAEVSIDGFDSSEIGSAASESTKLFLEQYGEGVASSMPKFFDSTVRSLLNNWLKHYTGELASDMCKHSPSRGSGFVDLRDLLQTAAIATHLGGTGLSGYGDTFRTALGFVRDLFKTDESTGLSGFNTVVIEPLTASNDGGAGAIHYPDDLFHSEEKIKIGALDTSVQFRAYDAKVENLNTVGAPLELFVGIPEEPYLLNNTITAGVGEQPLRFSSTVLLSLQGDGEWRLIERKD
ncbi:unnamed protein product [Pseudo-nitzschia multistriata]|uniref:Uncharacterized protein n=1 Tax=Pseudo-nitzschia multistriata TaxID=183589 RepID=A0A448ZCM3_9STRA|nr:unnamed protein product [Pseudo-nitzschia multistriata]